METELGFMSRRPDFIFSALKKLNLSLLSTAELYVQTQAQL